MGGEAGDGIGDELAYQVLMIRDRCWITHGVAASSAWNSGVEL